MPNNFYLGLLYTTLSDEKNSRSVHAYSELGLIVKPSAPFADMFPPISYKAFKLIRPFFQFAQTQDFFLSNCTLLNKENQVHNKRNPQKLSEKDAIPM